MLLIRHIFTELWHMKYIMYSFKDEGKASLWATVSILSTISNGPMYLGLNILLLPNLIIPRIGDILRNTWSPITNSRGLLLEFTHFYWWSCAAFRCFMICATLSTVWVINSGPINFLSTISSSTSVTYTSVHTTPQMVSSVYWLGNCYCKRIRSNVGDLPKIP